jgi:hypothetical protein
MRYFVVRGFSIKKDGSGQAFNFDTIEAELIAPAMAACGLLGGTTATVLDAGSIHADMFEMLLQADVVVCDITVHNANVFYELGIRHALRKKHTVLIKALSSADKTPFDVGGHRYLAYDAANPGATVPALSAAVQAGLASERPTDSPVFQFLPALQEANPDEVFVAPATFVEAVSDARTRKDLAALAALAADAQQLRYPWAGLTEVARAQMALNDLAGARPTWERLCDSSAHAATAHRALGNVYERLARGATGTERTALLERSNRSLEASLADPQLDAAARSETLGQQARNLKTLWRLGWEGEPDAAQRRQLALSTAALACRAGYRAAFDADLNSAYSGLAALQMTDIVLNLATDQAAWAALFESDEDADRQRKALVDDQAALSPTVKLSIERLNRLANAEQLPWAKISRADWAFLQPTSGPVPDSATPRLVQTYRGALTADHAFVRGSAEGQLRLFAALGVRTAQADAVLQAVFAAA